MLFAAERLSVSFTISSLSPVEPSKGSELQSLSLLVRTKRLWVIQTMKLYEKERKNTNVLEVNVRDLRVGKKKSG